MTMERDPLTFLKGEDLEYYRNIVYLKEMTKQATALMSRSNTVYNNILADRDVGVERQGVSASTEPISQASDSGRCSLCGTCHGADFCIVQKILNEDRMQEQQVSRSVRLPSVGIFRRNTVWPVASETAPIEKSKDPPGITPLLYAKEEPGRVKDNYDMVIARYGEAMGQNFLLAKSLIGQEIGTIEPRVTPPRRTLERLKEKREENELSFEQIRGDCQRSKAPKWNPLCDKYPEHVRKKMAAVLQLNLPCEATPPLVPFKWKDIFAKQSKPVKPEERALSIKSDFHTERYRPKEIKCRDGPQEYPGGPCPSSHDVFKKCKLLVLEPTNYLETVRQNMRLEKPSQLDGELDTVNYATSSRRATTNLRESIYQTRLDSFVDCVSERLNSQATGNVAVTEETLRDVATALVPQCAIGDQQWYQWHESYLLKNIEKDDQNDLDVSDFDQSESSSDVSDITTSSHLLRRLPRDASHIPYVHETYDLVDTLFNKISAKFEKSVVKNQLSEKLFHLTPEFDTFANSIEFRSADEEFMAEMHQFLKESPIFVKRFVPFANVRMNKWNRMRERKRKIARTGWVRDIVRKVQVGEALPAPRNSVVFTKKGNFLGFPKKRRRILKKTESQRFKTCDLIGDERSRAVDKKTVHQDYRFMKNLFDPPRMASSVAKMKLASKTVDPSLLVPAVYRNGGEERNKWPRKEENVMLQATRNSMPDRFSSSQNASKDLSQSTDPNFPSRLVYKDTGVAEKSQEPASSSGPRKEQVTQNFLSDELEETCLVSKYNLVRQPEAGSQPGSTQKVANAASTNKPRTSQIEGRESASKPTESLQEQSSTLPRPFQATSLTSRSSHRDSKTLQQAQQASHVPSKSKLLNSKEIETSKTILTGGSPSAQRLSDLSKKLDDRSVVSDWLNRSESQFTKDARNRESKGSTLSEKMGYGKLYRTVDPSVSEMSNASLSSATRSRGRIRTKQLGPTKKVSFGTDIGQGLNYIRYLKENAAKADDEKKAELLNLLTTRPEKKKKIASREPSKAVSTNALEIPASQTSNLSQSSSQTVAHQPSKKNPSVFEFPDSLENLKKRQVKTLDQIYKEVHGINSRNTPTNVVEREYEWELQRKQRLRKHREETPNY